MSHLYREVFVRPHPDFVGPFSLGNAARQFAPGHNAAPPAALRVRGYARLAPVYPGPWKPDLGVEVVGERPLSREESAAWLTPLLLAAPALHPSLPLRLAAGEGLFPRRLGGGALACGRRAAELPSPYLVAPSEREGDLGLTLADWSLLLLIALDRVLHLLEAAPGYRAPLPDLDVPNPYGPSVPRPAAALALHAAYSLADPIGYTRRFGQPCAERLLCDALLAQAHAGGAA